MPPTPLMIDRSRALPPDQYYPEKQEKNLIVLHGTAGGTAEGAVSWWISDSRRVATAYIIDRDGTIYGIHPPECWAYHLGIHGDPDHVQDKRSIGIEMVNWGPLRSKSDGWLYAWPGEYTKKVCTKAQTGLYAIRGTWRGETYWDAWSAAQIASCVALCGELCRTFKILPRVPMFRIYEADMEFFGRYSGIAGHHNFRSDKVDPGPAFPWCDFENAVRSGVPS